jgi:hypothetical protein
MKVGGWAVSVRPLALRPCLAAGLPFGDVRVSARSRGIDTDEEFLAKRPIPRQPVENGAVFERLGERLAQVAD